MCSCVCVGVIVFGFEKGESEQASKQVQQAEQSKVKQVLAINRKEPVIIVGRVKSYDVCFPISSKACSLNPIRTIQC